MSDFNFKRDFNEIKNNLIYISFEIRYLEI